jgi:hypothetical protein
VTRAPDDSSPRSGRRRLAGGASPPDDALRGLKSPGGAQDIRPTPPARAQPRTPKPKFRAPPQIFFPAPQAGFRAITPSKLHRRAHKRDRSSMGRGLSFARRGRHPRRLLHAGPPGPHGPRAHRQERPYQTPRPPRNRAAVQSPQAPPHAEVHLPEAASESAKRRIYFSFISSSTYSELFRLSPAPLRGFRIFQRIVRGRSAPG